MSNIFASGVQATAITNITAAINARISTDANGRKVLNTASLKAWIEAEWASISTGGEAVSPATAATVLAAAQSASAQAFVDGLNNQIRAERWMSRTDWPTTTSVLSGAAMVTAIKSKITESKRLSDRLSSFFNDVGNQLAMRIEDFYYRENIDTSVPQGVQRLIETRSYIYTYVTDRNEESAPSPASGLIELDQNDTVTFTAATAPVGRNISHYRIYRSNSSNSGAAFQYVPHASDETGWPIATLAVTDGRKAAELEEPCPTTGWEEPAATLQGILAGPNGVNAGFFANTWSPCPNYVYYAFPPDYQKTTAWPIVGQGIFGNTWVVLTRGKPYFISGSDSANMDAVPKYGGQACVAKASIVNIEGDETDGGIVGEDGGVIYACPDGLMLASASGFTLITTSLFTKENWAALVPSSIKAAQHEGCYVFCYNTGSVTGCYSLDLRTLKLTAVEITASAFYRDLLTDTLYYTQGTALKSFATDGTKRTAIWKSKKIVLPAPANFKFMQVESEYEASVTVRLYHNGTLLHTEILSSRSPQIVTPARGLEYEVQIESAAKVTSLTIASTAQELRAI